MGSPLEQMIGLAFVFGTIFGGGSVYYFLFRKPSSEGVVASPSVPHDSREPFLLLSRKEPKSESPAIQPMKRRRFRSTFADPEATRDERDAYLEDERWERADNRAD